MKKLVICGMLFAGMMAGQIELVKAITAEEIAQREAELKQRKLERKKKHQETERLKAENEKRQKERSERQNTKVNQDTEKQMADQLPESSAIRQFVLGARSNSPDTESAEASPISSASSTPIPELEGGSVPSLEVTADNTVVDEKINEEITVEHAEELIDELQEVAKTDNNMLIESAWNAFQKKYDIYGGMLSDLSKLPVVGIRNTARFSQVSMHDLIERLNGEMPVILVIGPTDKTRNFRGAMRFGMPMIDMDNMDFRKSSSDNHELFLNELIASNDTAECLSVKNTYLGDSIDKLINAIRRNKENGGKLKEVIINAETKCEVKTNSGTEEEIARERIEIEKELRDTIKSKLPWIMITGDDILQNVVDRGRKKIRTQQVKRASRTIDEHLKEKVRQGKVRMAKETVQQELLTKADARKSRNAE